MEIFEILKNNPIVPVLVLHNLKDAISVVKALEEGGIRIVEVTLRTPAALEIIEQLVAQFPKMIVGAGTVLTPEQMLQAKTAGARFIVSPGLTKTLSETAKELNIPYLPGAVTSSEVMMAKEMGYRCLKFFPSEAMGGIEVLKAYKQVFPDVMFCPTGGVDRSNFKEYLALENIICVGGSWLVTPNEVKEKDWGIITMMVKESLGSL